MIPKTTLPKPEKRISVVVIPSRIGRTPDEQAEGTEETEIAAQISVPQEGGWGWVVVFASFWCIFVLDGVAFTFGSIFGDMTRELEMDESVVAIINSIAIAMYFTTGPVTSALINRFGFRAITMVGAVVVAWSLFCSYFSTSYIALCIFYGLLAGMGYCFVNMSATLVVGFYFEKLRSLALAIATTGSSGGVMVMYPLNVYLVKISSWRLAILLHSAMFGIVYFLGMSFRPLLSLTVSKTTDDPTKTVTYLPSVSTTVKPSASRMKAEGPMAATITEKLFSAVSNINYPTAAAVVDEGPSPTTGTAQPGPSTAPGTSRLTITAQAPRGGISQRQLKQVQSIASRTSSFHDKTKKNVEVTVNVEQKPQKKKNFLARLFQWEEHIPQSRPMYRDDAFFEGKIETLPTYQKSMLETPSEEKTGLEYQLAVSRAVTTADLLERRGIFTTATRRILATMMDPKLLKRRSFLLFASSGFFMYLGYLVPYVFIADRNKANGIHEDHCTWFVSIIGFANAVGRLVIGVIACKIDPLKIFTFSNVCAGLFTILSDISYNVYYQYTYCILFGIFVSSISSLRSIILVQLYGLEKLTNGTGMMLLFQGLGCCMCTPIASILKGMFGYPVTFYVSGVIILFSGLLLIPVRAVCNKENQRQAESEIAEQSHKNAPETAVATK